MKKIILIALLLFNLLNAQAWAAQSFVVRKVEVEGLQRVSADTVRSYLPIKPGEVLKPAKTASIIRTLYKTGFFDAISLSRQGDVLIIHVIERPTIGQIKISGNSFIPTDKLNTVMKSVDIAEGRVFDRAMLDRIKMSLLSQYYQVGRYNARVDVAAEPLPRNRVLVKINISEGLVTQIHRINIIGNHAFTQKKLLKQFEISMPGLFTFITQKDRYSQEKLDQSLDNLRNFYLDNGYIKFAIKSSTAEVTPDRKSIYVTVVVSEGEQYSVKGFMLNGNLIFPRETYLKRIRIHAGDIFSRKEVLAAEKSISDVLGEQGYVFATVDLVPDIDEKNKQVFLNFTVKPGRRNYVRHIYFADNARTNDEVLRRELPQMEGAVVSTTKLADAKHRLSLLPFMKDVQTNLVPVPHHDDLVDVHYKVTEDNSANATFSIGYSQLEHLILGLGFNQKNFLGTGKTLGMNITESRFQKYYGMTYTNPYYTPEGVSRTISLSASKIDPRAASLGSYNTNQFDLTVLYSIPISQEKDVINRIQLGYGYQNLLVRLMANPSLQVQAFTNAHGRQFQQLDLMGGYSRDSRDKAIFPTRGMINTIGINMYLPVTGKSLKYYTIAYDSKWYHPIYGEFIATARGSLGYGNAFDGVHSFPYFKNFYAGGFDSVRGYAQSTLGPRDNIRDPTGGNMLIDGSIGLIFPNHISENFRTSVFIDGGNVYNSFNNRIYQGTASGSLRFSTGIEGDWLTPLGLIEVSVAKALNPKLGDSRDTFQFSLGANFG